MPCDHCQATSSPLITVRRSSPDRPSQAICSPAPSCPPSGHWRTEEEAQLQRCKQVGEETYRQAGGFLECEKAQLAGLKIEEALSVRAGLAAVEAFPHVDEDGKAAAAAHVRAVAKQVCGIVSVGRPGREVRGPEGLPACWGTAALRQGPRVSAKLAGPLAWQVSTVAT